MICINREVPQLPLSSLVCAPGICEAANVRRDLHTPNLFDELCAQARNDGTETFLVFPGNGECQPESRSLQKYRKVINREKFLRVEGVL
jgi:hypothetical protein